MRIVIDLQGAQSKASRNRGIGRYSLSIAEAIVKHKGSHEIILALSNQFPDAVDEILSHFRELLPRENIRIWCAPRNTSSNKVSNNWRRRTAEYTREAFLHSLKPDVVYITSMFEGLEDDSITTIGLYCSDIPTVVTLYDLIPLMNPSHYLKDPSYKQWYEKKIDYLKRADMLLSISESSRQEALAYLEIPADNVINISTASEKQFIIKSVSKDQERDIRTRYKLKKPFLMYTGANDPRKNQEGLIRSYALLEKSLRKAHQLVIVCAMSQKYKSKLETLAAKEGLEEGELIITGFVPEEDLIMLYNLCKAFIFPSWHEGFGLPALEAMKCGVPVIVGDNSSLPEVVGLKEALFDARDDKEMAAKIKQVLTDEQFRKKLIKHAEFQIKKFSWDISGKKAIEALESLEKTHQKNSKRLKLAYISPLLSGHNNISDHDAMLLPELYRYYDIDIIAEQKDTLDPWIKEHCAVHNVKWFKENAIRYNRILYHFGNSHSHKYMFKLLQEFPGIIVMEDFFFSDMISQMSKEGYQGVSYGKELYYSHGYKALQDTANLKSKYPVNKRVLDHAKGIIVHTESFEKLAEKWYGKESVTDWTFMPNIENYAKQYTDAIELYYTYRKNEKDCVIDQLKADEMQFREEGSEAILQVKEEGARAIKKIKQSDALSKKRYNSIRQSNSWKMTAPLRFFGRYVRWFFNGIKAWLTFAPESRPRRVWKKLKNHPYTHRLIREGKKTRQKVNLLLGLESKQKWRIEGPFDSSYSLALINREIAMALKRLGHEVALHSTEGDGDFKPDTSFLKKNPQIDRLYQKSFVLGQNEADVTGRNLYPPRVADMHSRINLLHNYAWEETAFPPEWVVDFNSSLQGLVLTSNHVKKIMIDNGVKVPLSVSGNGIDHWEKITVDKTYHITTKKFTFLHVSSCFPRKGADVLLKAYGEAFSSNDDVCLIIKTFPNPHNEIHQWLQEARKTRANYPDITIIEDDLTNEQLKALYLQCQALVGPSRAEGFGLPFAEAMLSGLPVITTGWSGQLDFCSEETAWLIDYEFVPAKTHFDLFDSVWAEPSGEHLSKLMRKVYELPDELRMARSKRGRDLLLGKHRWIDVAQRLVCASKIVAPPVQGHFTKIGWFTTWNTKCGIASYSQHLINAMQQDITVLAPHTDHLIAADTSNVYRCWNMGGSLDDAAQIIDELELDTIVMQFNYGFFDFNELNRFITDQTKQNRTVILMLHATTDSPKKQLKTLLPGMKAASRLLVHSYHDLNRLKAFGLVDNATLFPHGIPDWKEKSVEKNSTFTLMSYGFFLPHKGLLELVDAVKILLDMGIDVRLKMLNAQYSQWYTDLPQKAEEYIQSLGLSKHIEVLSNYLPDEECLEHLSSSDLIVFPYQETGESSSAAVRYGLASGSLVAVTPLKIFDDVDQAVFRLSGCTPQEMAESIYALIAKIENNSQAVQQKREDAKKWRDSHSYSILGERLSDMLIALKINKQIPECK